MATTTSSKTAKTTKATKAPKIMNYSDYSGAAPSNGPAKTDSKGNLVAGQSFYKGGAPVPGLKINKSGQATDSEGNLSQDRMGAPASLAIPNTPIPEVAPIQQPEPPQPGAITPQQGLQNALESGVQPPQDAGEARSQIQQYLPQAGGKFYKPQANSPQVYDYSSGTPEALSYDEYIKRGGLADFSNVQNGMPPNTAIEQQVFQDPMVQALMAQMQEYSDVANQRGSLTDEYKKLSKQLGIDEINTDLMNMKNVIEGTEDDLRAEVTKAGGFATESQIQALTLSRNKQLVKNYNNLLDLKQQTMETLNTMIGLAAQDRQFAMEVMNQKINFTSKMIEYRDKFVDNARQQYQSIINTLGYDGLLEATGGDPWTMGLVEKSLGLSSGQLQKLSQASAKKQSQAITMELIAKYPDAGISPNDTYEVAASKLKNSRIYQDQVRPPQGSGGGPSKSDLLAADIKSDYQGILSNWEERGWLNSGYIGSGEYRQAKSQWVGAYGGDIENPGKRFDELFGSYVNRGSDTWENDYGISK